MTNEKTQYLLKNYTTMRIGGPVRNLVDIVSVDQLKQEFLTATKNGEKIYVMGGGSNSIGTDYGYDGTILHIKITGFEVRSTTPNSTILWAAAGEDWDKLVIKTVEMGLNGIEALAAIPGTVGAAPVQNIGAYGQEVSQVIESVDVFDTDSSEFTSLSANACHFSYRNSIFRDTHAGKYIITGVTMKLRNEPPKAPFYAAVQDHMDKNNMKKPTAKDIERIVRNIRKDKLPDPTKLPNSGSFFKNAIVSESKLLEIQQNHPEAPHYAMPNGSIKIPTGWLIEKCGFKGKLLSGIRVHDKNCLVLINESAKNFEDLLHAKEAIISKVRDKFGIIIEQEPLIIQ